MMPLCFILILLFCETSAQFSVETPDTAATATIPQTTSNTMATAVSIPDFLLKATPDYPVAAGQIVRLHCLTDFTHITSCSWRRLLNNTWHEVRPHCSELTLDKPEESGKYLCSGRSHLGQRSSRDHTVYIISIQTTVGEKLGIAAFIVSVVTFIITLVILFWMFWEGFHRKATSSSAAGQGSPGPGMAPSGGLPKMESETDVYMNYTNTNQAYSDLDPNHVSEDNVYSSLS